MKLRIENVIKWIYATQIFTKTLKNNNEAYAINNRSYGNWLSLACVIHCLALPIVLVAIPNFLAIYVDSEYFHLWMVFAAIPISIYA